MDKEVYNYVADQESLKPEEVMMIVRHDWDFFATFKSSSVILASLLHPRGLELSLSE
ncbi:MAG: hypothetical protein JJE49_10710 [Peptostreptococcaceae bacterium]|nr:hypothetical protein [Peptostreptococcaceae bacterium]